MEQLIPCEQKEFGLISEFGIISAFMLGLVQKDRMRSA